MNNTDTTVRSVQHNCHELASCLQFLNKMMSLFLGANGNLPVNVQELKTIYIHMIPEEWQSAFINNDQDITNETNSLLHLQQYMTVKDTHQHALSQNNHSCEILNEFLIMEECLWPDNLSWLSSIQ